MKKKIQLSGCFKGPHIEALISFCVTAGIFLPANYIKNADRFKASSVRSKLRFDPAFYCGCWEWLCWTDSCCSLSAVNHPSYASLLLYCKAPAHMRSHLLSCNLKEKQLGACTALFAISLYITIKLLFNFLGLLHASMHMLLHACMHMRVCTLVRLL